MTSGLLFQLPVDKVPYVDMYWILHSDTASNTNLWRVTTANMTSFFFKQKAGKKRSFSSSKAAFFAVEDAFAMNGKSPTCIHFYVISVKKRIFFYKNTVIHVSVLVPTRKSSFHKIRKLIKPLLLVCSYNYERCMEIVILASYYG